MGIEDRIKTSRFQDDWHKATINVLFTNNWLTNLLEERASRLSITLQQFNVLRILRGQYPKPASNATIRERMINSTPDISRLVERIVTKGLVTRTKNKTDKRAVDLLITEKGLQLLEELEADMNLSTILSENLTTQEAQLLSDLLDKMRGEI
ncbi:MarR family winged helix-turn-helix transcriptional regulator [Sphingobacterium yanglingense]|uniref:DNA-binding MarR family transcriptional regulator n=1 Tax=Sphingobacterium yanglingense TaxID=1437280 RepID=A0A4R6WS53_9SPHI|nr:MarR family transcriptional regulator [Sphingobacterium yanglingense]TDQ81756.1 DNA-binding MarR family transcriptional regulator [Sphingobacterium yanglingense]